MRQVLDIRKIAKKAADRDLFEVHACHPTPETKLYGYAFCEDHKADDPMDAADLIVRVHKNGVMDLFMRAGVSGKRLLCQTPFLVTHVSEHAHALIFLKENEAGLCPD